MIFIDNMLKEGKARATLLMTSTECVLESPYITEYEP